MNDKQISQDNATTVAGLRRRSARPTTPNHLFALGGHWPEDGECAEGADVPIYPMNRKGIRDSSRFQEILKTDLDRAFWRVDDCNHAGRTTLNKSAR